MFPVWRGSSSGGGGEPSLSSLSRTVTAASLLAMPLRDTAAPGAGDPVYAGAPEDLSATQSQVQETNGWDAPKKEHFLSASLSWGIKPFGIFRADLKVTLNYNV